MTRLFLIDCYQDEPACLGVPPYLSPRVRYAAGAAAERDIEVYYMSIDQLRNGARNLLKGRKTDGNEINGIGRWFSGTLGRDLSRSSENIFLVYAGVVIPGKYLRGTPPSFKELANLPDTIRSLARRICGNLVEIYLCGPMARFDLVSSEGKRWEKTLSERYDGIIPCTPASALLYIMDGESHTNRMDIVEEAKRYGASGSFIVRQNLDYPTPIICEIETYQGCVRYGSGGCHFCTQSHYGMPKFRDPKDIIGEMGSLSREGITRFRLGGQSCFYSYGTEELGSGDTPRPSVEAVRELLQGIREGIKNIDVLHIDNVNPAVVAEHPVEAAEITRAVVKYCTPGNVAALGLESADPAVYGSNNLNSTPEQTLGAIKLLNKYGSVRGKNGMPTFLPGVNFLGGLKGESETTYEMNLAFLRRLVKENLLVRRINIRSVTAHGFKRPSKKMRSAYIRFKKTVREEIDPILLRRVIPEGTILTDVYLEKHDGKNTFGRQIGTYPVLVGFSYELPVDRFIDAAILSHSARSVTGVESPFPVNKCSLRALASLPGIGKKRAANMAAARPLNKRTLSEVLGVEELAEELERITGGMVLLDDSAE